ncbi:MAG: endonuclease III, partial [Candidatus Delongbacteria bacterium]|nr:endonuclease III [Candidatus Delongbacteria bacterium]
YPPFETALEHQSAFELLVATILSAQCTDGRVNQVTRELFKTCHTPHDFIRLSHQELEKLIYSTGFYRNKAKNIKALAQVLNERYQGQVPDRMEELIRLPGVGRKTANVVLSAFYHQPGIVVDTHVKRLAVRLGFTQRNDPDKIEMELRDLLPESDWTDFSNNLIQHGRAVCKARKPNCPQCIVAEYCPSRSS